MDRYKLHYIFIKLMAIKNLFIILFSIVFLLNYLTLAHSDPAKHFNVNLQGGYGFVDENWTTGNAWLPGADLNLSFNLLKRLILKTGYGIRFDYSQDYCWNYNNSGWICRPDTIQSSSLPPEVNQKYNGYEVVHIPYITLGYTLKLGKDIKLIPSAGFTSFLLRQSKVPVDMNLFGVSLGADIIINIGKIVTDEGIPLYLEGTGLLTIDFIPEDTKNFLGEPEQLYTINGSIYYEFKTGEKGKFQLGGFYKGHLLSLTRALRIYNLGGAYIGFSI